MQLHGLILVDKPRDLTSHDVVARARKALGQKSVGHTGTLDPIATGLLILVLGEATKLSDYLTAAEKSYRMKVRLGITTDTLDRTGKVLSETPCDLAPERIRAEAEKLEGDFEWPVPVFSAAKVDGKKLYEYGREGKAIETPLKTMSFSNVRVLEVSGSELDVVMTCSKGSFMRSWADELGRRLGVGGVMSELRRLTVGAFRVDDAVELERLEPGGPGLVPMHQALPDLRAIKATPREAKLMANGQIAHDLTTRLIPEQKQAIATGKPVFIKVLTGEGELLAILAAEAGQGLKIRRVFRGFA